MVGGNIFLERHINKLSFAILLVDGYTHDSFLGNISLILRELSYRPVRTAGNYFVFLDIPAGSYNLSINSDCCFDEDLIITVKENLDVTVQRDLLIEDHTPEDPIKITLFPLPCYPFPASETLVRGIILDGYNPVSEAELMVKLDNKLEFKSRTTDKGEFVIAFTEIKPENVERSNGKRYIKGDMGRVLGLQVSCGALSKTINIENIEVGVSNSVGNLEITEG